MTDPTLRDKIIRLAFSKKDLRTDLLPLVKDENKTASEADLRKSVIRIAHEKPELRPELLPLLK